MKLLVIRHGLPQRSNTTEDAQLSEHGHEQALRLARFLQDRSIDAIYSSPMQRALQTAAPLAQVTGKSVVVHSGLTEFDKGHGKYVPMEQLKKTDLAAWQAIASGSTIPDIAGFRAQVVAAFNEIIARHAEQTVAVSCHAGVINMWAGHVLGMQPRLFFGPSYTGISEFTCASTGQLSVNSLNETGHLKGLALPD